ncbi:hypothetical protein ACFRAO_41575 [Streptomyces sp. NPDC056656]|uniref:hypothetical protein n=1 Tax=Streptomyces sp. NPDC056656 TaxID=3345895 RepID=UPI0036B84059
MVLQDGLVEGEGQFEGGCHGGEARDVELGAQGTDTVFEQGVVGVADEGGDCRIDPGGAQIDAREELLGQVEFIIGLVGVEEGGSEGAQAPGCVRLRRILLAFRLRCARPGRRQPPNFGGSDHT